MSWATTRRRTRGIVPKADVPPPNPLSQQIEQERIEEEQSAPRDGALSYDPSLHDQFFRDGANAWSFNDMLRDALRAVKEGLQVVWVANDQVQVTADKLSIEGVVISGFDVTGDIDVDLDTLPGIPKAANTWYAVWAVATSRGEKYKLIFSLSATDPLRPEGYSLKRRVAWVRLNASSNIYRFINKKASDLFEWNEDMSASDFNVHPAAPVAVANTWEDVDSSIPAPPGCGHVWVDALIYQIAPGNMVLRFKDKDLTAVPNVNDTMGSFSRRLSMPIWVGVNSSRVFQIQGNATGFDVDLRVKSYEDIRC